MASHNTFEHPALLHTIVRMKTLRNEMEEIRRSFKLAMRGDDALLEKAIRQSLDLYALTGCQDIVFLGLKLACHSRKPDLVQIVFDSIFETTGHFGLLFFDVVFGSHHASSYDDVEEFEWYLKLASKKSYMFDNQMVDLVDVPYQGFTFAAHAASLARCSILLIFLRYGADPVKSTLLLQPPVKLLKEWDIILRVILRALPCPSPNLLKIEPGLVLVPRLKHLSKVVVRRVLHSLDALPEGIYDLDIPFELKEYLDLLRDL